MQANKINTGWMLPNELCWVEIDLKENNPQVYKKAQIQNLEAGQKFANIQYYDNNDQLTDAIQKVSTTSLLECNKEKKNEGWDDMVSMNILNDAEILYNVKKRFLQDFIFSYIGPTLIVMNPYKLIQKSFNQEIMNLFKSAVRKLDGFQQSEYPPHVYALSANAYVQLFANNKNQAIVISGESGAGKTENAKYSMKYLTSLSEHGHHDDHAYSSVQNKNKQTTQQIPIEEKILGCNPILESFGNSKTVRNNNSSRFGKYVRLWIEKKKKHILGACISNYLLEKSRVTIVADGERNYHIFYSFLAGANAQILNEFGIQKDPTQYNYLSQTTCIQVEGIDDIENFNEVQDSFNKLNFTPQEQHSIFSLLSAILHLGNIVFDDKTYTDQTPCSITNIDLLSRIASILQIDQNELKSSLVFKRIIKIDSPLNKQECNITSLIYLYKDSLSRALYDKLFVWLVSKLNLNIMPDSNANLNTCLSLGLLDIFGFENFKVNSFEQLCINFTNEKLQQLYIVYVFKSEEEEFKSEGLNDYMKSIDFKDNQIIIDLISKPPKSIYDLLDDQCTIKTGKDSQQDEALLKQIITQHATNQHLVSLKPHQIKDTFTIRHTAKDVEYTITGFRIKNKDEISETINDVFSKTKNNEIKVIWQYEDSSDKQQSNQKVAVKSKSNKFLGAKFRNQIKELMDELSSCDVHFIRCIKPNEQKMKNLYDEHFVMQQIRYLGILESVRVRKEGFPSRYVYDQFYQRYSELQSQSKKTSHSKYTSLQVSQKKEYCNSLIKHLIEKSKLKIQIENNVLFGTTKLYLKLCISNILDQFLLDLFKIKEQMALKITKSAKVYLYKKNILLKIRQLKEKFAKFIILQRKYKQYLVKKREKRLKTVKQGFNKINSLFEQKIYQIFQIFSNAQIMQKQADFFQLLSVAFQRTEKQFKQDFFTIFKLKFSPQQKLNILNDQIQLIDQLIQPPQSSQTQQQISSSNQVTPQIQQQQQQPQQIQSQQSQQVQPQRTQLIQNVVASNANPHYNQNEQSPENCMNLSTSMSSSTNSNLNTPQRNGQTQNEEFHNVFANQQDPEERKVEKTFKDEFSTGGLDVWPSISEKEDQEERKFIDENRNDQLIIFLKENHAAEFSTLNPKQLQIDLEKPANLPIDPDYNIQFSDIDAHLMKKVEENDFFEFLIYFKIKIEYQSQDVLSLKEFMSYFKYFNIFSLIIIEKNFGKSITSIHQIMSYSSNNLVDPLTQSLTIQNHAQLIFRSLLKLAKNRRSRFPPSTHTENIILMCFGNQIIENYFQLKLFLFLNQLGTPDKMQESIFSSVKDENTKLIQSYSSKLSSQNGMQSDSTNSRNQQSIDRNQQSVDRNQMSNQQNQSINNQSVNQSMGQSIVQQNDQGEEDEEPNIKEILQDKISQIVNNCHQAIRDETFMQLCKQINGQPTLEGQKILLQFYTELIGLFPPSDYLMIPLMSYFKYLANKPTTDDKVKYIPFILLQYFWINEELIYQKFQKIQSQNFKQKLLIHIIQEFIHQRILPYIFLINNNLIYQVQRECRYIFIKLAKIWQSYYMIKFIDFSQYTQSFLLDYFIYKDLDKDESMKDVLHNKISQFDFFYHHVQRVETREVLPTEWERSILNEHKLFKIKIYLLNEMSVTVTIQQYYSVKQVRDIILRQIGMSYRSQYFGIVVTKITDGKYYEVFLKNNEKILDVLNQIINDTKYLEGYKKSVTTKFYLRIKICYKLYKNDLDSTIMYFMQGSFDVRQNKHHLKPQEVFDLAAYHLFVEFGLFEQSSIEMYEKKCKDFIPNQMYNPKTFHEIFAKILPIYKSLFLESINFARWKYLELLRTKDTFMAYQLEAHQFCITQKGDKYQKQREGQVIMFGIRPYQIVLLNFQDKSTKEVIELEQIETWGLNQTPKIKDKQTQQFFFLKIKGSQTLQVFHILHLQVANLLLHSYALKKSIGDDDNEYKDCFLDILSILFDKEEQIIE